MAARRVVKGIYTVPRDENSVLLCCSALCPGGTGLSRPRPAACFAPCRLRAAMHNTV